MKLCQNSCDILVKFQGSMFSDPRMSIKSCPHILVLPTPRNKGPILTCFCASFFPFCPLSWPPLFLPFSRHIFALFSPSQSALFCREKCTAQSLERGSSGMDLSTKFGKEIPSRNLREKSPEYEGNLHKMSTNPQI